MEPLPRSCGAARGARPAGRVRARAGRLGLGRGAAAGGASVVVDGARARLRRRRAHGAHRAQRAAAAAPRARAARARPDQVKRRRRERDPRPWRRPADRRAPLRAAAALARAARLPCASPWPTGSGPRTSTRRCTRRGAPRPISPERRRSTLAWAGGGPALLGGDFNVRRPAAQGFEWLGGHGVDHVLGHGLRAVGTSETPDRGELSDHAPVIVTVARLPAAAGG